MKANKSDRNNLAIIGATSAGKTTLAVGLYATSTEDFTVSPVGDETSKYLEIRKTSIEEGFWPAAGLAEDNVDIRLRLHASGNQVDIVFREYMGERMERDPNYIREVIGTPKSAMILFNPGMPGLSKPETRNRMLGNLKVIAQHLKDNGCIAVAFVVTASDRLTSDLAASREDFEAYASEVTNHLTNLGLDWKRFDVTVSGQLDDQNKPKLARGENNTTHEPFLWLLKRIRDSKRRKCILTAAAVFASILGVSGAVFGGLVVHSRQVLTRAETDFANTTNELNMAYSAHDEAKVRTTSQFLEANSFGKIRTILPSDRKRKAELVNRANEQSDLWRVRLLSMELASNTSRIATKPLDVRLDWFEDFNKRLAASLPDFRDAVVERNTLTNEWAKSRGMLETMCQTAHFCYEVDQERKNLAKPDALSDPLQRSKKLIADEEKKYALVTNRAELCVSLGLMTARTNAIVCYVDSKMGKPEDDNPPEGSTIALRQQITKELKRGLTSQEFDNLPEIIAQRCVAAHKAWEEYHFPSRVNAQIDGLRAVSDAPANELRSSRGFLEGLDKQFPSIPEYKRSVAKEEITNERTAAIGRYLKAKAPWKPEDEERPVDTSVLENQVRQELQSALSDAEFKSLWAQLEKRCDEACRAWDAYHFPRRVTELETALKSAGSNPSRSLTDSLAFLSAMTNNYPTISQVEFIKAQNTIEDARQTALAAYENLIVGRWNVNGSKPPEFDAEGIRANVLTDAVVTEVEYNLFLKDMQGRFKNTKEAWTRIQEEKVTSFISRYLSSEANVVFALNQYMTDRQDYLNSPSLSQLDSKMLRVLADRLDRLVDNYYEEFRGEKAIWDVPANRAVRMKQAQEHFNELKFLCGAIQNPMLDGTPIAKSWCAKFAKLCIERGKIGSTGINGAFQQRFDITTIDVKVDFVSTPKTFQGLSFGAYIRSRYWFEGEGVKNSMSEDLVDVDSRNWTVKGDKGGRWWNLWKGNKSLYFNPWSDAFVGFRVEDRLVWGSNEFCNFFWNFCLEDTRKENWHDGYIEFTKHMDVDHSGTHTIADITFRIAGTYSGPDLWALRKEAMR